MNCHEEALVNAFITPKRRERTIYLLRSKKGRAKVIAQLAHNPHLDVCFAHKIAPSQHDAQQIAALLKSKGAPTNCCVISEWSRFDGRDLRSRQTRVLRR